MIQVFDDVLPDPVAYRAAALRLPFQDVNTGHALFKGIALCPDPALATWFERQYGGKVEPTLTFFRKSPEGQAEPNFIHTDVDMGDLTAILYLNPTPPPEDGTAFWRHRETGATAAEAPFGGAEGQDLTLWERRRVVPAAFNRCVVFGAPLFHSRAIAANYGRDEEARLIQVLFGRVRT